MESDFDGSKEEQVFNDTVREYVVSISLQVWQKLNRKLTSLSICFQRGNIQRFWLFLYYEIIVYIC